MKKRILLLAFALPLFCFGQTTTINGNRNILGDWSAGGANSSIPAVIGTGQPASGTCNAAGHRGRAYVQLDAASRSSAQWVCTETATSSGVYGWVLQSGGMTVGLTVPGIFSISNSPLTGAGGTLVIALQSQAANTFLAGPISGGGTAPFFRGLVAADIPSLDAAILGSGVIALARLPACAASGVGHASGLVPDPGASAGTTRFLREDCTWVAITGSNATQLQGRALASTAPSGNQMVGWSVGNNQWQPMTLDSTMLSDAANLATLTGIQTFSGNKFFGGIFDARLATKTVPNRTGTGSPNARDACANIGESYYQTDATAGANSWGCTVTGTPGTWALQGVTANQNLRTPGAYFATASATTVCSNVGYAGTITGIKIWSDATVTGTVDVKTVAFGSFTGAASASSITASSPAVITAGTNASPSIAGWTTAVTANTMVCFVPSSITAGSASYIVAQLQIAAN